jgi:putative nucleotidyltransferase with HDIG domain
MPREVRFRYEYPLNKPWQHENLYADFSFSIEKNAEELIKEKEEIRLNAKKYFYKDGKISKKNIAAFSTWIDVQIDNFESDSTKKKNLITKLLKPQQNPYLLLKDKGSHLLNSIYQKGIITSKILNEKNAWLIKNHQVSRLKTQDFFYLNDLQKEINLLELSKEEKGQFFNALSQFIEPDIKLEESFTKKDLQATLDAIPPRKGKIEQNRLLIARGQMITEEIHQMIESYHHEFEKRNSNNINIALIFIGQLLVVGLCLVLLFYYITTFWKELIKQNNNILFIFLLVIAMFVMAKFSLAVNSEYIYALPFCLLPLILKSFYETRLALFGHLITIILISFIVPNSFEFIFVQLIGGITSILTVKTLYKRADLFSSAIKIIVVYIFSYLSIEMLQSNSIESMNLTPVYHLAISGSFTVIAYPLVFGFEKMFGLISDVSLLELTDTNNPLLKELQRTAPGTFQHSLQVANLAESGIMEIEGNALLVRAGALYHDIGKMKNPRYFIENQNTGVNPHDELDYDQSAKIIINHVIDGIELAKKHKLPDRIIDFIRTHHGESTVQYFYRKYLVDYPDGILTEEDFKYPGPKPFSKETAVLMMADSVEAASKSLGKPDSQKINDLVDKIISSQLKEGQLNNADITLKEIESIKKVFKHKLRNIYHLRIEYPD